MNVLTTFDVNEESGYREFKKIEGMKKLKKTAQKTIANFITIQSLSQKENKLIFHTKTMKSSYGAN